MITIEKDLKAEEIFIYAAPEDLRELAKKLWAISEKADLKGKHTERLTTKRGTDVELCTQLQGEVGEFSVIEKLTISSRNQ